MNKLYIPFKFAWEKLLSTGCVQEVQDNIFLYRTYTFCTGRTGQILIYCQFSGSCLMINNGFSLKYYLYTTLSY